MKWKKLGKIFEIDEKNKKNWNASHSANPVCIKLNSDEIRVYFSTRDTEGKSNVGSFDYSMKENKIIDINEKPVMLHGSGEEVDSSGIGIGNIIEILDEKYMYYMAWQVPQGQHWRGDVARAKLDLENNVMVRDDDFLMTVNNDIDKVSLSYPFLIKENNSYYMWYGSTDTWDFGNGEMLHIINLAISEDGEKFDKRKKCIPYEIGKAQAFSRPVVIKWKDKWRMWYSYRGNKDKYKIGYAETDNLDKWEVKESNFYCSESGWDSEMVCYPYVFEYNDKLYMLYNGNGYGKTGIGLAVLEEE